jgi:hypothetical protein
VYPDNSTSGNKQDLTNYNSNDNIEKVFIRGKRKVQSVTRDNRYNSPNCKYDYDSNNNNRRSVQKNTKNLESFCFFQDRAESPIMTHTKKNLNKIVYENPHLKKESFNLKTFYQGNPHFSGENLDRSPINKNTSLNSLFQTEKNFFNKERYLHDMYNTNPIKQVSYTQIYKSQKGEKERNYNKSGKVSAYLGSNGVKNSVFTQKINYNDYRKEKVAEVNRKQNNYSNNNKYTASQKSFCHLYNSKVGFYLK